MLLAVWQLLSVHGACRLFHHRRRSRLFQTFIKRLELKRKNETVRVEWRLQETAARREAAHCADMMDCHILSAAHNATITGPKCRVCAAFTIEMRQSVGIEILIISFPRGLRAALQLGKEGDVRILRPFRSRKKRQDETSNSLVSTPISEWLFKKKSE